MATPAGATLPTGRAEASEMPAGAATQEPGSTDNRFQCNPNDPNFEPVMETEDGKQYRITMLATQGAPGDFTVDKVESCEEPTEEGESASPENESETGSMGMAKDKYPNPAVAKMMEKE